MGRNGKPRNPDARYAMVSFRLSPSELEQVESLKPPGKKTSGWLHDIVMKALKIKPSPRRK
jgi:hypothetical protein